MKVFALSDPHLSFGVPGKSMDRFGSEWVNHPAKIAKARKDTLEPEDIMLLPGDLSWAKKLEQALPDLEWLAELPGHKVLMRGNHDYWWPSAALMEQVLAPKVHFVHNNHVKIGPYRFFGSRLWDTQEFSVFDCIEWDAKKGPIPGVKGDSDLEAQEKQFDRELLRLKLSIDSLPSDEGIRIGMTHYPPLAHIPASTRASDLLQQAGAVHVVFGHLHSIKSEWKGKAFGPWQGVHYHLTSCDYLDFKPKLIHAGVGNS
jgi:predicted phosphohydrolase